MRPRLCNRQENDARIDKKSFIARKNRATLRKIEEKAKIMPRPLKLSVEYTKKNQNQTYFDFAVVVK